MTSHICPDCRTRRIPLTRTECRPCTIRYHVADKARWIARHWPHALTLAIWGAALCLVAVKAGR